MDEAVKAHKALRAAVGLGPEMFPVPAVVGMISDEVEILRGKGLSLQAIAEIIQSSSAIEISPQEIADNYALPEARHPGE